MTRGHDSREAAEGSGPASYRRNAKAPLDSSCVRAASVFLESDRVVRIRMKSMGRRHRPFFRICAMDARTPRDGRAIEELGFYDPMARSVETREVLNANRIRYWLSVGAQPSEKVQAILKRQGIKKPANGEPWEQPEPVAVATAPGAPSAVSSAPAPAAGSPHPEAPPAV